MVSCASSFLVNNLTHKVLAPEHLIHQITHQMHVLIRNLHKARATFCQQFTGHHQAVAEIREVTIDAQLPSITVSLDGLRLARDAAIVFFHVGAVDAHLPVAAILDAVGRVDVDALHLSAHPLTVQQRVHHQQGVAQDEAVLPVLVVLIVARHTLQFVLLVLLSEHLLKEFHLVLKPGRLLVAHPI